MIGLKFASRLKPVILSLGAFALCGAAMAAGDCPAGADPETSDQPVHPPAVTYPAKAAQAGLSGKCEIRFDVTKSGQVKNIVPNCSSPVFDKSARDAASTLKFAPKIVDGKPVERSCLVYPLEYKIQ